MACRHGQELASTASEATNTGGWGGRAQRKDRHQAEVAERHADGLAEGVRVAEEATSAAVAAPAALAAFQELQPPVAKAAGGLEGGKASGTVPHQPGMRRGRALECIVLRPSVLVVRSGEVLEL